MGALLQNKKILIGGLFVAVLAVAGYLFSDSLGGALPTLSSAPGGVVGDVGQQSAAISIEQELIDELLNLKSITLDRTPLDDPSYQTLQDFSRPIDPEPIGRVNPFLPFDGAASSELVEGQ